MANQSKKRLCGGTFLVLLLDAKGKRQTTRSNGRKGDGRNNPDVFERLLKITIPDFIRPTEGRTFNTFTTEYKNCRESDTPSVRLTYDETIRLFDNRVKNNYQEVAIAFDSFIKYAVDIPTHGKRLVASLLDLIDMDDIPGTQKFFIRPDGTSVYREDILNEERFPISTFLLGIWHYIVCNVKDNETRECKATLEYLLGPKGGSRAGREVNCNIGISRCSEINVEFELPYGKIVNETLHRHNGEIYNVEWPDEVDYCNRKEWISILKERISSDGEICYYSETMELEDVDEYYIDENGEPDLEGVSWEIETSELLKRPDKFQELIIFMESDDFPLKKEYNEMRKFTGWLDKAINSKSSSDDWFDAF